MIGKVEGSRRGGKGTLKMRRSDAIKEALAFTLQDLSRAINDRLFVIKS